MFPETQLLLRDRFPLKERLRVGARQEPQNCSVCAAPRKVLTVHHVVDSKPGPHKHTPGLPHSPRGQGGEGDYLRSTHPDPFKILP